MPLEALKWANQDLNSGNNIRKGILGAGLSNQIGSLILRIMRVALML